MAFASAWSMVQQVGDLFSLPEIQSQIDRMIRDPRCSSDDIAEVIGKDPALTTRLLRLVNSPFYAFRARIDNLPRAIAVVGIDDLYNLVVATCVVDQFAGIANELCAMSDFWLRSVRCAVVGGFLAKACGFVHGDRLFVAGLLRDIGSLVMYQTAPEESTSVLRAIGGDRRQLATVERDVFGFTHAEVGYELLRQWRLPDTLSHVVQDQLDPLLATHFQHDAQLIHVAGRLVDDQFMSRSLLQTLSDVDSSVLTNLRLNFEVVESVMTQTGREVDAIVRLLGLERLAFQGRFRPN